MSEAAISVPVSRAFEIADRIDTDGYAVVDSFVPPEELKKAQEFVLQAVSGNGGEYIGFSGSADLGGTFLERLSTNPDFIELCRAIYRRGTGAPAPDVQFYQVLRCLSGVQAKLHSMRFHYDSYVLTALMPIMMPSRGSKGNLIIIPKMRPIRKTYGINMLDKFLVDNRLAQTVFKGAYRRKHAAIISLEMKPGNLYFFWGYRSLHTNEPCEANEIRSTALLHYADPHAESGFKRTMRAMAAGRGKRIGSKAKEASPHPAEHAETRLER